MGCVGRRCRKVWVGRCEWNKEGDEKGTGE